MANYKKSLNHTQTGHSNPTFCDRRRTGERNLEHESREWSDWCEWSDWNDWCEWSKSYVTFVTNVTNVTNATNVTNVKQEMAIRGDVTRHSVSSSLWLLDSSSLCLFDSLSLLLAASSPPVRHPKIQQFWVIFQRFDINIFNFREHFPPPNFAYSAHNFALPSPNLN